jgi:antitoxin component YwqK of YwqJK toxin-antitoxin module
MDQLLYAKVSEHITDPKTWRNWVLAIPFRIYDLIVRKMIPQKQTQFTIIKEIIRKSPKLREIYGELPNGNYHGLYTMYEQYRNDFNKPFEWRRTMSCNYNNGIKEGEQLNYHPSDQQVTCQEYFSENKLHGMRISYHPLRSDGTQLRSIKSIEEFRHGVPTGKLIVYHPNGEILREYIYNDEGKRHGKCTDYRSESGEVLHTTEYNNGEKHGLECFANHTEILLINWKNGQRHGEKKIKDTSGRISLFEIWEDGSMIESIVAPQPKVIGDD